MIFEGAAEEAFEGVRLIGGRGVEEQPRAELLGDREWFTGGEAGHGEVPGDGDLAEGAFGQDVDAAGEGTPRDRTRRDRQVGAGQSWGRPDRMNAWLPCSAWRPPKR